MPLILYVSQPSTAARAAMMVTEFLNTPVKFVELDLVKEDQMDPSYLKKNPLHSVPVLEDGDLYITDSHAIISYLVDVYGTHQSLYPKDPRKRALVDQKLHFDNGCLFNRLRNVSFTVFFERILPTDKQLSDVSEAYGFLEEFLTRSKWLAGDHMTIADICAFSTLTGLQHILPINAQNYQKLQAWFSTMVEKPFYIKHGALGNEVYRKHLHDHMASSKINSSKLDIY